MHFSVKAILTHSLLQARGPHLSPCLTPLCGLILVIMPGMHELRQPERVFQNLRANEDLIQAQLFWGEEEEEDLKCHCVGFIFNFLFINKLNESVCIFGT